LGNAFNLIAAGKAGASIAYGLGQGATLVSAFCGVFIWREFKNAPKGVNAYLYLMFLLFLSGLILMVISGI